ncbi:MAG: hypothetical protein IJ105_01340 [Bacilli bacterium]|nr:hypothetical protein [Bacilli bacterium]
MNVNFEAIEKAWGKPKKDVLDELEEWAKANQYIGKTVVFENDLTYTELLDKIQELKKEN